MIKFRKIKAENFMSFAEFELEIPERGLRYIIGDSDDKISDSNGAGKSAIWEALCWALYGRTIRGTQADEVIREGKPRGGICRVSVLFDLGDTHCKVVRGRDPGRFELWVDGKDRSGQTAAATQEKIDDLLGMTFGVFANSVIFGQGLPFRFTQATDSEKKTVLDKILQFEWMTIARENAKSTDKVVENKLEKELWDQSKIEGRLQGARTNKEQTQGQILELQGTLDAGTVENSRLEKAVELEKVEKELRSVQTELARVQGSLPSIQEKRDLASEAYTDVFERHMKVKTNGVVLQRKILDLIARAEKLKELSGGECPTCGQDVPEEMVSSVVGDLKKEVAVRQEAFQKVDDSAKKLLKEQEEMQGEVRVWKREAEAKQFQVKNWETKRVVLSGQVTELDEEVGELEDSLVETNAWEAQIELLEKQVLGVGKEIAKIEKELKEKKEKIKELGSDQKDLRFWVDGFGNRGIKSMVLESIMPMLNDSAKVYSDFLTDGEIQVEFSATSMTKTGKEVDKLDVQVKRRGGLGKYIACSGGEKRRADVVVLLALHDLISRRSQTSVNLIVFDEVLEALDVTGAERLYNLLETFSEDKAVFVISHKSEMEDFFNNVIRVVKRNGVSRIP